MRVLLADDQPEIRSAMRLLLEQESGVSVVGEAAEAHGLLIQVQKSEPDIVLLDWELPGEACTESRCNSGYRLVGALRADCPQAKIIALSGRPEARQVALEAGCDAFVSKGDPPERLLEVLGTVAAQPSASAPS